MTDPFSLYAGAGVIIFGLGLLRLCLPCDLLRRLMALNVMGSGIFLVLIATAWRDRDPEPDPIPHALVLTGIVVSVSVTALSLVLARSLARMTGSQTLDDPRDRSDR